MVKLGQFQKKDRQTDRQTDRHTYRQTDRQMEGITIESFEVSKKKNGSSYMKFDLKLPNNILEKVGLEGHSKLLVTKFYSKIRVGN